MQLPVSISTRGFLDCLFPHAFYTIAWHFLAFFFCIGLLSMKACFWQCFHHSWWLALSQDYSQIWSCSHGELWDKISCLIIRDFVLQGWVLSTFWTVYKQTVCTRLPCSLWTQEPGIKANIYAVICTIHADISKKNSITWVLEMQPNSYPQNSDFRKYIMLCIKWKVPCFVYKLNVSVIGTHLGPLDKWLPTVL